jgi:hypothetical protein
MSSIIWHKHNNAKIQQNNRLWKLKSFACVLELLKHFLGSLLFMLASPLLCWLGKA